MKFITNLLCMLFALNAFAGFTNLVSVAKLPSGKVVEVLTAQYADALLGTVDVTVNLIQDRKYVRNAYLSVAAKKQVVSHLLGKDIKSLKGLGLSKNRDSKVIEIDLVGNNSKIVELNVLQLVNSMGGKAKLYPRAILFDQQGYRR